MEKLARLKEKHFALEKRIQEIGKEHFRKSVELSQELAELIEEIEATQEREKIPSNQALSAKIKIVKYGVKLAKRLKYFEEEVVIQFDRGNISKEFGKALISVTKRIKDNKMPLAKQEFGQFQEIISLSKEYEESKEALESESKALRKEQYRLKQLLRELSWLEAQSVDLEKAQKHEEFLQNLKELEKLRASYLYSLASEPVAELVDDAYSLRERLPIFPPDSEIAEIKGFFSHYPAIGGYQVGQICEMLTFTEQKLSHLCPETSKFKKAILANKKFFDELHSIGQSSFLAVDGGDEKVLEFYAAKVGGAQPIVAQIRELRKESPSCKAEYEKKERIEEKKRALSKYSKESLEAGLEEANSRLEFLNSKPAQEGNKPEKGGLLSKISYFFKG